MVRTLLSLVVVGVVVSSGTRVSGDTVFKSALHDYRVVPFVEALVQPWSIAFLPGGDILITERPGRLRIVRNGKLLPQPVEGVPQVVFASQAGLLEVAPHPNFASNRMLYLTYSKNKADGTGPTTALVRGRFENDRLTGVEQLFESVSTGRGHFGGKIAFDKNGFLFLTLGDRQVPPEGKLEAHPAQDLSNHHGKMIRLHDDGRVPADNPFVNRAGAKPEIWSYGHRNVQGLAIHPETGEVWANEHGPQGGDEINRDSSGPQLWLAGDWVWRQLHDRAARFTRARIARAWSNRCRSWCRRSASPGMMFYTGDKFPQWRNHAVCRRHGRAAVGPAHAGEPA